MAPYYSDGSVTIYHGDAREIIPTLPDGLTVSDPPYNIGYHYGRYLDSMSDAEYWSMLEDVLNIPLVFIHYPEALFPLVRRLCVDPKRIVAWVYNANTPRQWRAVAWFGCEPDLTREGQDYKNQNDKRVQKLMAEGKRARLYDWWHIEQVKNVDDEKTEHPCQIPLALMKRVLTVTDSTAVVIDPFMGSGTTLRAAKDLGRSAIGIDVDERYCEIAAKRLSQGVFAF